MFGFGKQTVRPRSARWMPAPLCLVAFCLTALVVYCWGTEIWIPRDVKPKQNATAYVIERAAKPGQSDVRIPMAANDDDPRRAEAAANARADAYVKHEQAVWQRSTAVVYHKARQAVELASRELAQSEDRLEAFRRQITRATAKPQATGLRPESSPSQAMIDNPKWLDLDRRLGELQRRRDSLLINRTPAHPAVEDVAVQIKDLQRQMAAIPRQILNTAAKSKTPVAPPKSSPAANDSIAGKDTEKLSELTDAAETTRRTWQQASAAEKLARNAQRAGPRFTVVYARVAENSPRPDSGWQRLLYTTLSASMLMAVGAAFLSAGANIQPPVASVAEVQAAAGVPIMATIPPTTSAPSPLWLSRRQTRLRRTLLAVGLLLALACPAAAVWGLMGV
jgi:uncharacterized protein involved in exopolysaccharide biosynthesis